jgi:hypothetical protein
MLTRLERWKKGAGKYNIIKYNERLNSYNNNPTLCKNCNEPLDYSLRKNKFCNHSCSAKFTNKLRLENGFSNSGKLKQVSCVICSTKLQVGLHACSAKAKCKKCKSLSSVRNKEKICTYCNKQFITHTQRLTCSKDCEQIKKYLGAQKGGLKSAAIQSHIRRSKNEVYFAELCKKHFTNVVTNEQYFNGWDADVILPDLKIAILWNGSWHYKKITKKHSVLQVQNRDKIKIQEIKNKGYFPYIIKDTGIRNNKFVEEQFSIFLKLVAEEGFEPSRPKGGAL